jgi:hypothetical protein
VEIPDTSLLAMFLLIAGVVCYKLWGLLGCLLRRV